MVKKNSIGKKVVGAAVSMAMMVAAVPAMTSLACENDFGRHHDEMPHGNYGVVPMLEAATPATNAQLCERLTEVINLYYQNQSILPGNVHAHTQTIINEASLTCRNPYASANKIAYTMEQLDVVYNTIMYYVDLYQADSAAKNEALQRLLDVLDEMTDFGEVFSDEIASVMDIEGYHAWIAFGAYVYFNDKDYTTDYINELSNVLAQNLDDVIRAIDAASQPAEEVVPENGTEDDQTSDGFEIEHQDDFTISPDFQIDPQDSFTIEPEQIEDVALDYGMDLEDDTQTTTEAAPATVVSAPAAPSAPATMVAGAARNIVTRESMAEQIVERLYGTALNRKSDAAGKAYWVRMILAGNGNIDMVVSGFLNSAEFNARNLTDDEFVTALYTVILNRVPTSDENTLWTNALTNGASRRDVINAFVNSSEFETTCEAYDL